jgi:hypothetical protein
MLLICGGLFRGPIMSLARDSIPTQRIACAIAVRKLGGNRIAFTLNN